ncbi:probable LRR receptor-like serine/threonine-protein kinase At1g67720 [Phoenix dactylifera]|uniref:Probable LRR receptor-like serine/threonine-protein kinase At1g67720 n=1 Tax=Phoenix dactylifera TaxID=42345 RepID=A0A8B7C606_PHODC|nr:probable LRR receptor-like serine/threonine-protein kinase At1g67720 [Phoenix dactylifera]
MANNLQFFFLHLFLFSVSNAQMPGFLSLDCGGTENHTDDLGLEWTPDNQSSFGGTANVSVPNETRRQFTTVRYFPADNRKYCYTLDVITRTRYLVRASFLYGNFDNSNVYPKFDISIGATYWSTIVIYDADAIISEELILLASSPKISVCLSNATTGQPFISALELRQFNNSLYHTEFEAQFFMSLCARINFGAETNESVRYPDDPFDRIWESDSLRRANYLVDVAPGTEKVSTTLPVDVSTGERPPQKVMQTAVVGQNGTLTYRLNLDGFPGFGWAFSYFAEIEDFGSNETRKFKLAIPGNKDVSKPTVNIEENAPGKYRLYEPGYYNISLPFVFSFAFVKTNDSSRGPILNALEIYKYLQINYGSQDAPVMAGFTSHYLLAIWAQEGGDPCLPTPWSWVKCSSDPQPKIISINLSGKNLTGNIPSELMNLSGLAELWLDGNMLTGPIPDFGGCLNLKIIHLENNQLTGELPSSLVDLPSLRELYVQNNMLSGTVPRGLLSKNIVFVFSGNMHLREEKNKHNRIIIVLCSVIGASVMLMAVVAFLFVCKRRKFYSKEDDLTNVLPTQKPHSPVNELATKTAHKYTLSDIEEATENFSKKIGSGGFGTVYYGKMKDEKEIAVKVLRNDSYQENRQFSNEVSLLSRIHHRNLVVFLGYCQQEGKNILVYEFMHNGTFKEHLHGTLTQERRIGWLKRLEIAEDSAKGIEYLHTGCSPAVIHRDLKTSNILLDKHMRAKVSDFGLSKPAVDESHVSGVKGTLGYLDPVYCTSQQLTEKSDIYSFGVILLVLISGQEPISTTNFGENIYHIGPWAKFYYESGEIEAIIDPSLQNDYNDIQSVWKIAEVAVKCIDSQTGNRPSISEVLKEIQEAIAIERGPRITKSDIFFGSSLIVDAANLCSSGQRASVDSFIQPDLR